jgi:hypothetical protein
MPCAFANITSVGSTTRQLSSTLINNCLDFTTAPASFAI